MDAGRKFSEAMAEMEADEAIGLHYVNKLMPIMKEAIEHEDGQEHVSVLTSCLLQSAARCVVVLMPLSELTDTDEKRNAVTDHLYKTFVLSLNATVKMMRDRIIKP